MWDRFSQLIITHRKNIFDYTGWKSHFRMCKLCDKCNFRITNFINMQFQKMWYIRKTWVKEINVEKRRDAILRVGWSSLRTWCTLTLIKSCPLRHFLAWKMRSDLNENAIITGIVIERVKKQNQLSTISFCWNLIQFKNNSSYRLMVWVD